MGDNQPRKDGSKPLTLTLPLTQIRRRKCMEVDWAYKQKNPTGLCGKARQCYVGTYRARGNRTPQTDLEMISGPRTASI